MYKYVRLTFLSDNGYRQKWLTLTDILFLVDIVFNIYLFFNDFCFTNLGFIVSFFSFFFWFCFVFCFCFCPGTCHDEVNNFRCDCPAGYLGRTCDNATNECSTNPCKNGGTCWDLHLDYVVRICSQQGGKVEVCFNSCNKFKTKYLKSYIVTCIP